MTVSPRTVELLRDLDRPSGWVLLVDGVEQSYVDVDDPTHLEFEYMQHMALVIDAVLPPHVPVHALHLGGGAMAMPRWVAATRPGSTQVIVESSPEVVAAVEPLGPVDGCSLVAGDAMEGAAAVAAGSIDLLVWDLYDGPLAVTSSLTSVSFALMHQLLAPTGVLVLNVSDVMPFDVVRPVLAALRVELREVMLVAEPSTLRGRRSGNCVLVAADMDLPARGVARRAAAAPVRGRVLHGSGVVEFVAGALPPTEAQPLPPPDERSGRAFL